MVVSITITLADGVACLAGAVSFGLAVTSTRCHAGCLVVSVQTR